MSFMFLIIMLEIGKQLKYLQYNKTRCSKETMVELPACKLVWADFSGTAKENESASYNCPFALFTTNLIKNLMQKFHTLL